MRKNTTGGRKYFPQTIRLKDEQGVTTNKTRTIYHRLSSTNKPKK